MKGFLISTGTLALCTAIAMSVLYFTTDIFTRESESSREIGRLTNYVLAGLYCQDWSMMIQAGKTISISWEADGSLNAWVLTQSQCDYLKVWGTTSSYEAMKSGRSGTLIYRVSNTDTYHLIVQNPSQVESITVYSAVATVQ